MDFYKHPDEIVRECRQKSADSDNLTPSQERELKKRLATNQVKQSYYNAKEKVLENEVFLVGYFSRICSNY